jgi:hypothetical protein
VTTELNLPSCGIIDASFPGCVAMAVPDIMDTAEEFEAGTQS